MLEEDVGASAWNWKILLDNVMCPRRLIHNMFILILNRGHACPPSNRMPYNQHSICTKSEDLTEHSVILTQGTGE
jgi:hypothetical protein